MRKMVVGLALTLVLLLGISMPVAASNSHASDRACVGTEISGLATDERGVGQFFREVAQTGQLGIVISTAATTCEFV